MPSVRTLGDEAGSQLGVIRLRTVLLSDEARPVRSVEVGNGYTDAKKIAGLLRKCK